MKGNTWRNEAEEIRREAGDGVARRLTGDGVARRLTGDGVARRLTAEGAARLLTTVRRLNTARLQNRAGVG